jgi:hypothetical protein
MTIFVLFYVAEYFHADFFGTGIKFTDDSADTSFTD